MSYSYDVKEDILKLNTDAASHHVELEALLRNGSEVIISNPVRLIFSTSNRQLLRYFIKLIKEKYPHIEYAMESREQQKLKHQMIYDCIIVNIAKQIIEDYHILEPVSFEKDHILKTPALMQGYLRGAFLIKGSVNHPRTSNYHLEIATDKEAEALFLQRMMNHFDLNARITKRRNQLIVYLKEKDKIVDCLRYIGANVMMNEFENIIIKRGLSAHVNRIMNIDVANQQKTNSSAKEQLRYIRYLEYNYPLEKLDDRLKIVMKVRKDNPEASLNELVAIINSVYEDNITKSGLNHRFRRLKEIALDFSARKNGKDENRN